MVFTDEGGRPRGRSPESPPLLEPAARPPGLVAARLSPSGQHPSFRDCYFVKIPHWAETLHDLDLLRSQWHLFKVDQMIVRAGPLLVQPQQLETPYDPVHVGHRGGDNQPPSRSKKVVAGLEAVDCSTTSKAMITSNESDSSPSSRHRDVPHYVGRRVEVEPNVTCPAVPRQILADPPAPAADLKDPGVLGNGGQEVVNFLACVRNR